MLKLIAVTRSEPGPERALIPGEPHRLLRAGELAADEARVEAAAGEELGMAARLDNVPAIEHREPVGVAHGRKPVRDDDRRAVAHQRVERAAHLRLADRVEMRGRLVEDQSRRVLQERAGDRDALALSAGELHATLTDDRIEPLGQARDKIR